MANRTLASAIDVYELGKRVGAGSLAEVYAARARSTGTRVAVKMLLPAFVRDEEFIRMFVDEARIGSLLDHENLVTVLDAGRDGGVDFMVQQFVDGHPAAAFLERASPHERDAMVCHIVGRVALALEHLHTLVDEQGQAATVIHRDVYQNNILVGADGVPRLIDLGIARPARHLRSATTQVGILKGRFAAMSPEQVRGLPADGRSDLYALGIVLYEWLAGRRAYVAQSDFDLLEKVRKGHIAPLRSVRPDVPVALEHVVVRALALDPDDRYATAAAMSDDLLEAVRHLGLERSTAAVAAAMARAFRPASDDKVLDDLEAVPSSRRSS